MRFTLPLLVLTLALPLAAAPGSSADWPGWRGPKGDGHAAAGQSVPTRWSETENVKWRAPLRGRGHSSPTIVGERIFLTSADPVAQEQIVLCLDRASGRQLWETVVHRGSLDSGAHRNSSPAASSVTWDGERLFINFPNNKGIHTTALDPSGRILWQKRICDFVMHQGFGSSPVLFEHLVIVSADHRGGGVIAALDRKTGEFVWQHARPKIANYTTPALLTAAGRVQLVLGGCNLITSLDPRTGKPLWQIDGSTEECVTTAVTDGQRVFVSGGYPRNNVTAVEADGSGRIAWQNNTRAYVPSKLVKDGHLYAVLDAGQAVCWRASDGTEVWREKVDRDFYASPVMLGDRIYVTSLKGVTSVFEANPGKFALLAQNKLGDEAIASPVICGNRLYLRSTKAGEPRQDFLWCIGE
ncbi:MAG: PQQ-binding-like beta-propeller repeat protein [Verrucomicrobia bacterium]|nr:PQQ-binding-like beta-propeller repeat protein [Verrucomicrobiota bacterium]